MTSPSNQLSDGIPDGPVLVCGGAGYIGSHCTALLQKRGV
ncbi:MAG: nucleoside-diphosphate-sugar epimerase, partial [Planctomycetota bacterium]